MASNITVKDEIGIGFGGIRAESMTQEHAEVEALKVNEHKVQIDWEAPAVCIDGRTLEDILKALPLGAHLAGGAETLLVGARSIGFRLSGKELVEFAKTKGFILGGHDADSNKADGYKDGTGCGACDKCEGNCSIFKEYQSVVKPTMNALLGEDFNDKVYENLELKPVSEDIKNLVGENLIETLHDDHEGVHGHREQFVVFNYEENTTIDRDAYFKATGKQVFVVDVWYIKRLAHELADNTEQASEFYHSMMAFQVATYLGLCDGTHRPIIM